MNSTDLSLQHIADPVSRDDDLDLLSEQWVSWSRSRRLYGPRPAQSGTLGRLAVSSTRPVQARNVDAVSSAALSAFHIAYTCQPDALDRRVFEAYYVLRVRPVKRAADALGISRKHFYAVLKDFRQRLANAAGAIQAENQLPRLNQRTVDQDS